MRIIDGVSKAIATCATLVILSAAGTAGAAAPDLSNVPVSAPIDTDSAGRGGEIAQRAVLRLICPSLGVMGTGFLHKSGNIVTADHVVREHNIDP